MKLVLFLEDTVALYIMKLERQFPPIGHLHCDLQLLVFVAVLVCVFHLLFLYYVL